VGFCSRAGKRERGNSAGGRSANLLDALQVRAKGLALPDNHLRRLGLGEG
jgi:hypothetical protein